MQTDTVLPAHCTVAIIGAGPAGLSLAAELCRLNINDVHVLERNQKAGGIPVHCNHYPFGLREFTRLYKGPDYAHALTTRANAAGATIHTGVTVTALKKEGLLNVTDRSGARQIKAEHVVLCTGVRESSRAQRMISGDRCQGIVSTGALQPMIFEHGLTPFKRPVILGTELVSFSAIMTCNHAAIKPLAMIEAKPHVVARPFTRPFALIKNIPIYTGSRQITIHGEDQVQAVSFEDSHGQQHQIKTDGVIVSGHFRPESALLRMSHIDVDPGTGGPQVNQYWRCSDPAYSSAGNVLRPVETAGWCWREGRDLAKHIASALNNNNATVSSDTEISIQCDNPALQYCMPQRWAVSGQRNGMQHLQIRVNRPVDGVLQLNSADQTLWSRKIRSQPERRILIPIETLLKHTLTNNLQITFTHRDQ